MSVAIHMTCLNVSELPVDICVVLYFGKNNLVTDTLGVPGDLRRVTSNNVYFIDIYLMNVSMRGE